MTNISTTEPTFRPFVEECRRFGISRSVAYELANKGLLETVSIGKKRYVITESLRTLPDRLRGKAA
jgi:predicted site-specific integrase-resolvase